MNPSSPLQTCISPKKTWSQTRVQALLVSSTRFGCHACMAVGCNAHNPSPEMTGCLCLPPFILLMVRAGNSVSKIFPEFNPSPPFPPPMPSSWSFLHPFTPRLWQQPLPCFPSSSLTPQLAPYNAATGHNTSHIRALLDSETSACCTSF